jgi:glycosyltransferase involved in cell wall biosynthesis
VSILNILPGDLAREAYEEDLVAHGGDTVSHDGATCRAVFQGVNYRHEILPVARDRLMSQHQPAVGAVQRCLQQEGMEYVLTTDEGYWPLLAAWQLQISGAHFFHALSGVKRFARNPGYVWLLRRRTVVANSRFMQAEIRSRLGLDAVVWYPFINLDAYRCRRGSERRGRVGFYSAGRIKGSAIVAEIAARMPEREFLVAGAYGEAPTSNMVCWGHIQDMRRFYQKIDLLLVPSVVEEAFGRVILEAAANGIPSIANRVGGIPEALGDSGILIDWAPGTDIAETAGKYVAAIRALLDDAEVYHRHSQQALARADEYEKVLDRMSQAFCDRYLSSRV